MTNVQDRAEDGRTESEQTEGAGTPVAHDVHRAFTPGPWYPGHLGSDGRCQCRSILDGEHMGGIATVHVHNGIDAISEGGNDAPPREQAIANMHLIAAAPDLLEACREAGARLRYSGDLFHDQGLQSRAEADWAAMEACLAAVAKAEGYGR